jgi:hypothetical protein
MAAKPHWTDTPAGSREENRRGIGLNLVRGLVGRELHGRFSLAAAPDGSGTIATVEFEIASALNQTSGGIDDAIHEGTNGGPNGQGG